MYSKSILTSDDSGNLIIAIIQELKSKRGGVRSIVGDNLPAQVSALAHWSHKSRLRGIELYLKGIESPPCMCHFVQLVIRELITNVDAIQETGNMKLRAGHTPHQLGEPVADLKWHLLEVKGIGLDWWHTPQGSVMKMSKSKRNAKIPFSILTENATEFEHGITKGGNKLNNTDHTAHFPLDLLLSPPSFSCRLRERCVGADSKVSELGHRAGPEAHHQSGTCL
jgi:hypothetical protein